MMVLWMDGASSASQVGSPPPMPILTAKERWTEPSLMDVSWERIGEMKCSGIRLFGWSCLVILPLLLQWYSGACLGFCNLWDVVLGDEHFAQVERAFTNSTWGTVFFWATSKKILLVEHQEQMEPPWPPIAGSQDAQSRRAPSWAEPERNIIYSQTLKQNGSEREAYEAWQRFE